MIKDCIYRNSIQFIGPELPEFVDSGFLFLNRASLGKTTEKQSALKSALNWVKILKSSGYLKKQNREFIFYSRLFCTPGRSRTLNLLIRRKWASCLFTTKSNHFKLLCTILCTNIFRSAIFLRDAHKGASKCFNLMIRCIWSKIKNLPSTRYFTSRME